jgi:hypothetical protein
MKDVLKITFEKSNEYKVIAATGAWGGLSSNNEVVFDFFIEKHEIPKFIELEIKNGKKVGEKQELENTIIRELQVGVVLRPDIAHSIGEWLIEKAKTAGFKKTS